MKKDRAPSLLRQLISIHAEEAKTKKAMRILTKQKWSIEFLEYMLVRCASKTQQPLEMQIVSPEGATIIMHSEKVDMAQPNVAYAESDILMHLDDDAAVNQFIKEHATR